MDEEYEEENLSMKHKLSYSYKPFYDHILCYFKILPKQVPNIVAIIITGWAIAEIFLKENHETMQKMIFPLLTISFLFAIINNYKKYKSSYPEVIKSESEKIKNIYFIHGVGWQYKISYEKLKEISLDKNLQMQRIKKGSEYIPPLIITENEYLVFIRRQLVGITSLVKVAKIACIEDMPKMISEADDGNEENLIKMVNEINHFKSIYNETINFEKEAHSIVPPEIFEELNKYIYGWSEPVINGLNQFIENLKFFSMVKKSDVYKKDFIVPESHILFEAHENLNKFNEILDSLDIGIAFTS